MKVAQHFKTVTSTEQNNPSVAHLLNSTSVSIKNNYSYLKCKLGFYLSITIFLFQGATGNVLAFIIEQDCMKNVSSMKVRKAMSKY